jgi:raffinose/stachyose/melibiose transport system permease protein
VWRFLGYTMAIYVAGLTTIPEDLYEAAAIDGVSRFQRFRFLAFPLLAPCFTINLTLATIGCLKLFDQIYAMTRGGLDTPPTRWPP